MTNPTRKAVAATMILAPLLGIVSAIAAPPMKGSASGTIAEIAGHQNRWYVYALFVLLSSMAFVPAIAGLTAMASERAPRLGLIGGGLALLGMLIAVGDSTVELMFWQMGARSAGRAQMVALAERFDNAAGSSLVFTIGGLALLVGLLLLGLALRRGRLVPAWAAFGVLVGAVVNIGGFGAHSNALVIASNVILLVAFVPIARLLAAGRHGELRPAPATPRAVGATG